MRKSIAATLYACIAIAATACSSTPVDDDTPYMVVPPSPSTPKSEISAAIKDLISTYPVCIRVPLFRAVDVRPLNLDPPRLGLNDEDAELAFDVMVRLGYMTKVPRPDLGDRVVEFKRTQLGDDAGELRAGERVRTEKLGVARVVAVTPLPGSSYQPLAQEPR